MEFLGDKKQYKQAVAALSMNANMIGGTTNGIILLKTFAQYCF